MKKKIISVVCAMSIILGAVTPDFMINASAVSQDAEIIQKSSIPLVLHYDEEAPYGNENMEDGWGAARSDDGWERWSLPIGNGYFGANVFGRTQTERIQITEKTLANPYYRSDSSGTVHSLGGLNNFSETYLDFGHTNSQTANYNRYLDLETAVAGVEYDYNGVTYTREYFTSYPDKALVIRLDASTAGALDFVLRPTIPWEQDQAAFEGDRASKHGTVTSHVDNGVGVVELTGKMEYYDIDFMGLYRVITKDGTVTATNTTNSYGETDGTITVSGATSAYIYVTLGTDYELTSEVFTSSDTEKPTFNTTIEDTREKITGYANAIAAKLQGKTFDEGYNLLKANHIADHSNMFGRVSLNLGDVSDAAYTTDVLVNRYKAGNYSKYMEALYFQYGRYLLIASSRAGALPANLQGTWNRYNYTPWSGGYWHNINVQMNYWPAFNTNIAETFDSYVEYNRAYMEAAEQNASQMVSENNPSQFNMDGGNGWVIGTANWPYEISGSSSAGDMGFTTQIFWQYYQYTKDKTLLENVIYPVLVSAARYVVKSVELDEEGHYLVSRCDSPEQWVNGQWYYTKGTTYAQTLAYLNNYSALTAAKELGIDLSDSSVINSEEYCVFKRVIEQLDKYDPIHVGLSGQIKEFREEEYYGDLGEYQHRHVSQLVGLYPGNIITSKTPAWLDAAKVSLTNRGDHSNGWSEAHRMCLWARTKEGQRAYDLLNCLLTEKTATNLWDLYPPFQIEGNLGGTAGICEMLLQSHEGYIEPLAAIPAAWSSGSYTGLVAEGNFEVSAKWSDGKADVFNIKSNKGGRASVYRDNISTAHVVLASTGETVEYTVDDKNLISFETTVGETYIIYGLETVEKLAASAGVTVNRQGLNQMNIYWQPVSGAVSYNVYVAKNNQPDYTLVTGTSGAACTYFASEINADTRYTFKVMAVDENGNEGKGAICYENPVDINASLLDYEATLYEETELQVTVRASSNTQSYKLWEKAGNESEYTLVSESSYPIIVYGSYEKENEYAISLVSKYLHTESELYEISKITKGVVGSGDAAVYSDNLFAGKTFIPNDNAESIVYSSSYGYDKLTDGVYQYDAQGQFNATIGRFATRELVDARLDGTVTLNSTSLFSEMRLYNFSGNGTVTTWSGIHITAYVLSNGQWNKAAELATKQEVLAATEYDSEKGLYYVALDLAGAKGNAVRVVVNADPDGLGVTFYEITCNGFSLPNTDVFHENILLHKTPAYFASSGIYSDQYNETHLTDGSFHVTQGRFALLDGVNNYATVEYDIDESFTLDTLKVYDFIMRPIDTVSRVSSTTVEVYSNGEWTTVIDGQALLAPDERFKDANGEYTPLKLNYVKGSKIRITFMNTAAVTGVTIYEIELTAFGRNTDSSNTEDSNILLGKTFTGDAVPAGEEYGYDKLTNGDESDRFALSDVPYSTVTMECDLENTYKLYDLTISDCNDGGNTRCREVTVETYYCGQWKKIVDAKPLPSDKTFSLGAEKAERLRITCCNNSGESKGIAIKEILCSAANAHETSAENVLADCTSITQNGAAGIDVLHPLANAVDGDVNTYCKVEGDSPSYVLTFDMGSDSLLYSLNICEHKNPSDIVCGEPATRSDDTYVELFVNGNWLRVTDGISLNVQDNNTLIDLYGLVASKIRIGFNNTQTFDNGTSPAAEICEITCSVSNQAPDKKPLLDAYSRLPVIKNSTQEYKDNMQKFADYVTEFALSEEKITAYSDEITAYRATLLGGTHTAHNIVKHAHVDETCEENGCYAYEECTLCDYSTYEYIPARGHELSGWIHDEKGHWKECAICGERLYFSQHTYDDENDTTCECGFVRIIGPVGYSILVTVQNNAKQIDVFVDKLALYNYPDLAVSFTLADNIENKVTAYTVSGETLVFGYTALSDDDILVKLTGENVECDSLKCNLSAFTGEAGTKYLLYSKLDLGDANGDGTTNIKDLARTKKILAGLADSSKSADLSGNLTVAADDLVLLAKYLHKAKKGLPAQTVVFKDIDETVLSVQYVLQGFGVTPLVIPERDGFIGWSKETASIFEDTEIMAVYKTSLIEGDVDENVPEDWEYGD